MEEILRYIKLYTDCDDFALKRIKPILEKHLKPKVVVKNKIIEIVRFNTKAKPDIPIQDYFSIYKDTYSVTYKDITRKCRRIETLKIRNAFVRSAIEQGYTQSEIARYLGMNHTTILNIIKKSKV
jgi:hypothetical protein